ncbi:MAG: outer membrane protein assembly factor BamD [Gammaproteobacteria bacterium]
MRFLFVIFFSFSTLFMSGCWWEEEEVRGPISDGLSPKALFNKAQEFRDQGALDEAIKTYEQLQAAYPSSKYSMQSKLETPYALYKRERYDEAIDKLNDFIKIYPNHFSTPYAFYLRGIIAEDKSKSILDEFITDNAQRDVSSVKNAMNYYLALMDKFPNTEYAIESKAKLVTLRNILARHELFVAIFYTKKEAYIASINRCKYIIEKFPNTPSVPAALHLIAHNYDKINAPKLAEDSRRVLKASYPKYKQHYSL